MADESYSFSTARTRLEAIVTQVRKKDTSLEKSLDLLEEGVRLANACTELIDQTDWTTTQASPDSADVAVDEVAEKSEDHAEDDAGSDDGAPADDPGADDDSVADER